MSKKVIEQILCDFCGQSDRVVKNGKISSSVVPMGDGEYHDLCYREKIHLDELGKLNAAQAESVKGYSALKKVPIKYGDKHISRDSRLFAVEFEYEDYNYAKIHPDYSPEELPSARKSKMNNSRLESEKFERAKKAALEKMAKELVDSGEIQ